MSCLETVQVGWRGGGGLVDMAVAPTFNQLVGVSISSSAVTTYIADVKSCVPFTSPSSPGYSTACGRISDSNTAPGIPTTALAGSPSPDEVSWSFQFDQTPLLLPIPPLPISVSPCPPIETRQGLCLRNLG